MQARARMRLAAISASFLFLTGLGRDTSAGIVLDNDVVVDWQQGSSGRSLVVGAPRLVPDLRSVRIHIDLAGSSGRLPASTVELSFFTEDLRALCTGALPCTPLRLTYSFTSAPKDPLSLVDFLDDHDDAALERFIAGLPSPVILTVSGSLHLVTPPEACCEFPRQFPKIILSGGTQTVTDRVGDVDSATGRFHPGDALDVPPRSIELARALSQIEAALPSTQAVELDAIGSPRAQTVVGFTHAFDFPRDAENRPIDGIHSATLKLRLARDDHDFSADFILLDRAVRSVVTPGRPRVPIILLKYLDRPLDVGNASDFTIQLRNVPVSFLTPGDPVPSDPRFLDLTEDLQDGRLNVIVAGHSTVGFSDLRILFDDPGR